MGHPAIVGSAVLFASPIGNYGPGQYLTDIRPYDAELHTKAELSLALFGFPNRWGDSDVGFVGIDVQGLNVVRKGNVQGTSFPGKGEFLNETTVHLSLAFRIRSFGPLIFAQ
jgi:hypothetical protein